MISLKRALVISAILFATAAIAQTPLGSGFTYHGVYQENGSPVTGTLYFRFSLWDADEGGNRIGETQFLQDIQVENGVFTVILNRNDEFGTDAFNGEKRWLQIEVCPDGAFDAPLPLIPRQELTGIPYALNSLTTPWNGLTDVPSGFADGVDNSGDSVWQEIGSNIAFTGGKVGIGTSTPISPMTIFSSQDVFYGWIHTDGIRELASFVDESGGWLGTRSNHDLQFFTNNSNPKMTLTTDGKLGIGTKTPEYRFEISDVKPFGTPDPLFHALKIVGKKPYFTMVDTDIGGGEWDLWVRDGTFGIRNAILPGPPQITINSDLGDVYMPHGLTVGDDDGDLPGIITARVGFLPSLQAIYGSSDNGNAVVGESGGATSAGVVGRNSVANGIGVLGEAPLGNGVVGINERSGYGAIVGRNTAANGIGVYGEDNSAGAIGVYGKGDTSTGVYGEGYTGVYGYSQSNDGVAVRGIGANGAEAGHFDGSVVVTDDLFVYEDIHLTGDVYKKKSLTKIDHPLDPENKYLTHASVESSELKNIYDGNITTNEHGDAVINLPDWFEPLNTDFRYQLTVVGQFAQAIVSEKIHDNTFSIKTDKPNVEVSWMVTGIRNDPSAQKHPIVVEEKKRKEDRGKYISPEDYGQSKEKGIFYHPEPDQPSLIESIPEGTEVTQ